MNRSYKVSYYTGDSSKRYDATLYFERDKWTIQIIKDDYLKNLHWELSKIQPQFEVGTQLVFKYGDFPQQTLQCNKSLTQEIKKSYPNSHLIDKKYAWINNANWRQYTVLTTFLLLAIAGVYFYVLPVVAEKSVDLVPMEYEVELGEFFFESFMEEYIEDDSLSILLNEFASHMDLETQYPIQITGVNHEMVNAFALPGGNVVVFEGILSKMDSYEALCALLGHEVSHVHYRHSLKGLSRNMAGYLFISVVISDINAITTLLLENAHQLNSMTFSRELEKQADDKGMEIMLNNKIDLQGAVSLFEVLKKESDGLDIPEFLSTHPLSEDRMENAREKSQSQEDIVKSEELEKTWKKIQAYLNP